jgi:hypothetical protein
MIKDWHLYCIELLKINARLSRKKFNIIVGNINFDFNNSNPTFRIILQIEHTLVKSGGRDSDNAVLGRIPIGSSGENYLTRIVNKELLEQSDIIIDYSRANLINVKKSSFNATLGFKYYHFVPLLYQNEKTISNDRSLDVITMFGDPKSGRRKNFLELFGSKYSIINVNGVYKYVWRLYRKIKILINIHQTDQHCTAEELRIIPAAISGVIVLAELSPLLNSSYTKNFAIWGQLDDLAQKADHILKDYENFRGQHFGEKFERRLKRLTIYNDLMCKKIIRHLENKVL